MARAFFFLLIFVGNIFKTSYLPNFLLFPSPFFSSVKKHFYVEEWILGPRKDRVENLPHKCTEKVSKFSPRWSAMGIFA